jgi:Family of unknown function (DUF6152)
MRRSVMKVNLAIVIFGLGMAVMPLLAHHSVEEQYDTGKVVTIQGAVFKTVWVNPHTLVWVDTDRAVSSWEIELPPPNALRIRNVTTDFLKEGDQVTVTLWRAKDGSRLGHALTLTTPDGKVMNFDECMRRTTC